VTEETPLQAGGVYLIRSLLVVVDTSTTNMLADNGPRHPKLGRRVKFGNFTGPLVLLGQVDSTRWNEVFVPCAHCCAAQQLGAAGYPTQFGNEFIFVLLFFRVYDITKKLDVQVPVWF